MSLRAVGDRSVMVELEDAAARRRLDAALRRTPIEGLVEHVPAARTVLLRCRTPSEVTRVVASVRALDMSVGSDEGAPSTEVV